MCVENMSAVNIIPVSAGWEQGAENKEYVARRSRDSHCVRGSVKVEEKR